MKNIKKNFGWACDLSENKGEGILANSFLLNFSKYNNKITVKSPKCVKVYNNGKIISNKKNKSLLFKNQNFGSFLEKYFNPFYGLFFLWTYYFKGYQTAYINYLPIWNVFLLIFLPPQTIFGPITGGKTTNKIKYNKSIIRDIFIPLLSCLGIFVLNLRQKKIIFSTDILSNYIPKQIKKKCIFNFNLLNFLLLNNKKLNKKIDLVIYNRNHPTKKIDLQIDIIKKLINFKFKIHIIGNKLRLKYIKNHGFIKRKQVINLLKKSKFIIGSGENFYSIFALDAIATKNKVFFDERTKPNQFFFEKNNFIKINLSNTAISFDIIKKNLNKKYSFNNTSIAKVNSLKKKIDIYFKSMNLK